MADRFFEKEEQWKERYGWLIECRNKEKEESRANEKLKRKQKEARKEKKEVENNGRKDEAKQKVEAETKRLEVVVEEEKKDKEVPMVEKETKMESIPPILLVEPSEDVTKQIRSVVFGSVTVTEASDFGNEWLNELTIEEDIDLALLDINSLAAEETLDEIDYSDLDKLHENYLSHERMRLSLVNTIHAGATPMKSFININSPEQASVVSLINVVSDSPMDMTKRCKLPSGLTINMDCLKCLEMKTMLSGSVLNFFMETTTFIGHNKLGEHYLLSCDTWDYIEMFTNPKTEYNFELAKSQLMCLWRRLKIKSTRWCALMPVCYNKHWTLIEIIHPTQCETKIYHFDSLNRAHDSQEVMRCIERWLKLVTQTTKVTKQPVLNLPQQSAGSNDCGVFVCAFIEYAGLIFNWDELHEICKSQRSENNRKAIRERIEFFRVDREPNKKWYDSSFKMAEWIKKEEPKQVKQEAKKVFTSSFWDFPGSPQLDYDTMNFYVEPESLEQRMFPNIVVGDIKPFKKMCKFIKNV
jgi:hypothetical protein